tara:strand:+ start:804 stop:1055 length:252 start_codon:yes stop_codon:yes gene_type:complete
MNKLEILQENLAGRHDEVMNYQINIDNFTRAIAKIDSDYAEDPNLFEFRESLVNLLASNKTEQLKTVIIRDVIAEQVAELEGS